MQTIRPVKSPHPQKNQTSLSNFKYFALLFFYIFKHSIFSVLTILFLSQYIYICYGLKKHAISYDNMSFFTIYNSDSNSATVMPNCWLATSEVRSPWRTRFSNIDRLPSAFPRSSPCSIPSDRPCSRPSALAVSKA